MESPRATLTPTGAELPDPILQEKDILPFTRKLDQIDRILNGPVETLVEQVCTALERDRRDGSATGERRAPPRVPSWLSETMRSRDSDPLSSAICCSTVQRLWRIRRRFPQLKRSLERLEKTRQGLQAAAPPGAEKLTVPGMLAEPFARADWKELFQSAVFGPLDPFTASQVLNVLLNAGERQVHAEKGFLAFFLIVQGLRRRFPEQGDAGVSLGFCPPHAWVTAKCWLPAHNLARICRRRGEIFFELARWLEDRTTGRDLRDPFVEHRLKIELDDLSARLCTLSELAIPADGIRRCARDLEDSAVRTDGVTWAAVFERLAEMVVEIGTALDDIIRKVESALGPDGPQGQVHAALNKESQEERAAALEKLGLQDFIPTAFLDAQRERSYWENEAQAAGEALEVCKTALAQFESARDSCRKLAPSAETAPEGTPPAQSPHEALIEAFKALAKTNAAIGASIAAALRDTSLWCERQLHRQVAHASAGNETYFDPAELVGALMVAVKDGRIDSPLPLEDAIRKVLRGRRSDGSWAPGQPFFSKQGLGAWAASGDISWMLADLSSRFSGVTAADDALSAWVDWAERNRQKLVVPAEDTPDHPGQRSAWGWGFERGVGARIDLWATAYNLNALLEIRDLMEHRLWELCKRRFTVLNDAKRLSDIDPVDLGLAHEHRLHHRLARMARRSAGDDYEEAEYSLILHGPPGSSKTAITQALADVMWPNARTRGRDGLRLIRVTPADFTRLGEDRIDSEARLIFELLRRVRGVTVLFDEIDDLLRQRAQSENLHFLDLVVPAMLNRLQDLREACPHQETCFLLATNYIDRIERALIRKGRIDAAVAVVYPDRRSRDFIVHRHVHELRATGGGPDDAWKVWGADLLDERWARQGRDLVGRLDGVPWKTINEVLRSFRRDLKELFANGGSDADGEAWERLKDRIEKLGPQTLSTFYDAGRLKDRLASSPELQEEVLLQILATVDDRREEFDQAIARGCKEVKVQAKAFPRKLKDGIWQRRAGADRSAPQRRP